jgi:hypothetical protein
MIAGSPKTVYAQLPPFINSRVTISTAALGC